MSGKPLYFDNNDYRLAPSRDYKVGVDQYGQVIYLGKDGLWHKANTTYNKREGYKARAFVYIDGVRKNVAPSRLVGETFLPNFDPNKKVLHIDGDASNNHFSNLTQADGGRK